MKAVFVEKFAPIDQALFTDVADPSPGRGEILIDVSACESNYPDLLVMEGNYQIPPPLPFVPGKAASGTVAALGEGVTGFHVGEKVSAQVEYGAYAQKLVARADASFPMPKDMPFDVGAALGLVYQTSYFALIERAHFAPGETVLVLGASGGIGSAAVHLAKALGAAKVIGAVLGANNVQYALQAGCDHVIDLSIGDMRETVRAEIFSVTDGKGVDIVVDPVGGAATAAALRAIAWSGRLVVIGFASGEIPVIKGNYLLVKNITVSGLQWSDYRQRQPAKVKAAQDQIFGLWAEGKLSPMISKSLPLARFREALEDLRHGRAQGKIVLIP